MSAAGLILSPFSGRKFFMSTGYVAVLTLRFVTTFVIFITLNLCDFIWAILVVLQRVTFFYWS